MKDCRYYYLKSKLSKIDDKIIEEERIKFDLMAVSELLMSSINKLRHQNMLYSPPVSISRYEDYLSTISNLILKQESKIHKLYKASDKVEKILKEEYSVEN